MSVYSEVYKSVEVWEISPERLRQAMVRAGVTQSALAATVGVRQPSIGRLLTGETRTTRALDDIARALATTPAYLIGDEGDPTAQMPTRSLRATELIGELGVVAVREVDLALGFGAAYLDQDIASVVQYFPRAWLDLYTRAPADKLIITRGSGDSMAPTLFDADLILIDTTDQTPRLTDQIWAISYCGLGSVKRLRPSKDGGWLLMSDNPTITPITAYDDEMHVLGRVCAYFRKV